ncbi:sorting nexin-29-like isoform X1 [Varroa destructor]|uniref:Sorting nexin-29 n=1 Tax=Varroa destructor TaxID=109461 RepID=A0A7M7JAV8_VARDE|nr:sorting nexin-29-like isoform X1 [Varroa destructor]XP_022647135.1 sorting nexin-29-like isoform X1 [Varroa destructor]XP_022647136.1 sorting nexin-29-like isoform X1 [Varroa destructor]XP_022647137.1 sorting nexin-29-like isoform X1 [Varroa destructor]
MNEHERERRSIQVSLLEALKECQIRFGSGQELATEQDARVAALCTSVERAFRHGIRPQHQHNALQPSLANMVRGLLTQNDVRGSSDLFAFIWNFLSKHELERFQLLKNVRTDAGRARAWIRCALNEHSLEKYCKKLFGSQERARLEKFYESWAFLRDEELCAVFETMSQGMKSILFALNVDSSRLDPEEPVSPAAEVGSAFEDGFEAPAPVMAPDAREGHIKKKKKRSTHYNPTTSLEPAGGSPSEIKSSPPSSVASPIAENLSGIEDSYFQALGKSPQLKTGLTPITDSVGLSYGDLIPVKSEDTIGEDTLSTTSGRSERACAYSSKSTSLSEGELREALEAMVERRKQLECDLESYRERLASERERTRRAEEKLLKAETRQGQMLREMEQVKGQLRKYVHAVQMLKANGKDNRTASELHSLEITASTNEEGLLNIGTTSTNSLGYAVDDPTNYEAKLVQVAEMHAELMEFNERLQRQLALKESAIRRLRDELTDLRGPLAEEDSSSDSHSVTSDYDTVSQFRPSINIWIPSVFLAGQGSDAFHVYQIYIRIGEEEWNVYRRYSQFYSMHKALLRGQSVFASFDFPPKKSLGNKDAKLVQERRKRLQRYLRCVINWLLQGNSRLSQNPDKATLTEAMPFFGDRDQAHFPRRRQSPIRRAQEAQAYYNGL